MSTPREAETEKEAMKLNSTYEADYDVGCIARLLANASQGELRMLVEGVCFDIDTLRWRPPGFAQDVKERANKDKAVYPIRIAPTYLLLGPIRNGKGPCSFCLERRWTALRPFIERHAPGESKEYFRSGRNPLITPFVFDNILGIVEKALQQHGQAASSTQPYGEVYSLSLATHKVARYLLIRDSFCPSCSGLLPDTPELAVIELAPARKLSLTSDRGHRPKELGLPEAALVNPLCGMLGKHWSPLYDQLITTPVSGQYNVAGRNNPIWWGGHSNSYGESVRIGLLEGLERHAGLLSRKKGIAAFDSYNNLKAEALNPADCGLYPEDSYKKWPTLTPYNPDLKFSWVWGYSLTEGRPILVPKQLVYYSDFMRNEPMFVQECSNGCAIGSNLEEAILHSLLELIERDGFLISWFTKLPLPKIDPWSCKQRDTLLMLDRIELMGLEVYLLDMRLDMSIPRVICLALRRDGGLGTMMLAASASLEPEKAIHGALCEVGSYITGFPRRISENEAEIREMMNDYTKVQDIEQHAMLYGLPEMAVRASFLKQSPIIRTVEQTYEDWNDKAPRTHDLLDDLRFCIDQLRGIGLTQVIVVDQTSPEQEQMGLRTTCLIVPGLISMDFGYGRDRFHTLSRIQTVPCMAGFRANNLTQADFNPLPHPFP
jgi:ribosomal protein S12 methylthiotransferase accessory factor